MNKIIYSGLLLAFCPFSLFSRTSKDKPLNVLLITADDLNYSSVGYMGCQVPEITPNLDRLASEGVVFHNAYVNIAVSQPSRAVLATGLYSHNNGVEGFYHTDKDVKTLMSILESRGYMTGIAGKLEHSTPVGSYHWGMQVDMPDLGQGRDPQRYYEVFNEFVKKAKSEGKPFYFMANSHDPHAPFHGSDRERKAFPIKNFPDASRVYTAEEVEVPGFIVKTEESKIELAQYFSSVRRLDVTVGMILKVLKEQGLEENTLVMFLSDNGMDFPFAKTNCYYNSNRTPWVVKWPNVVKPGSRDREHFIASIDFMPTVLEACGFSVPSNIDGHSFLPVLIGKKQSDRKRVFTQFYETSAKGRFPMFAIHDADYCYIYNAWFDGEKVFKNCSWGGMTFKSMVTHADKDAYIKERLDFFKYRTREELYDVRKDPDGLTNLVDDKDKAAVLKKYRKLMEEWLIANHLLDRFDYEYEK